MLEVVFQSFLVDFGVDLGLFLELILDVHVHELPDAKKNEFESKSLTPPPPKTEAAGGTDRGNHWRGSSLTRLVNPQSGSADIMKNMA